VSSPKLGENATARQLLVVPLPDSAGVLKPSRKSLNIPKKNYLKKFKQQQKKHKRPEVGQEILRNYLAKKPSKLGL